MGYNPIHEPTIGELSHTATDWSALAGRLLAQALGELQDADDTAVSTATAAREALRAWAGDPPGGDDSFDELVCVLREPGELTSEDPPCTCPPDLAARGGFTSGCPAHGAPTSQCSR